jgi:hypothetical protein
MEIGVCVCGSLISAAAAHLNKHVKLTSRILIIHVVDPSKRERDTAARTSSPSRESFAFVRDDVTMKNAN